MPILPLHCEIDQPTQARARKALRRMIKESPEWARDDTSADAIVEQVWNALVGHDKIRPPVKLGRAARKLR